MTLASIVCVVVALILANCIKIVPKNQAVIVERSGKYHATWNEGLHFKIPFIEKIVRKIDANGQMVDIK